MKLLASAILASSLCLGYGFAHADSSPTKTERSDCAKARKQGRACSLTFEQGSKVDGNRPGASGSQVLTTKPTQHTSLIRLRKNFRDKILLTASGLD